MINLGSWMNGILIGWGIDPKIANTFDEMIIAALLVILAIGLDYLCQAIFVGSMKKLAQHTHYQWDSLLLKRKVVHHLVHTIPGILVYALLPLAFIRGKGLLLLSQKICAVYIVFALLLAINGFILVFLDMYNMRQGNKNRPIKGFMQVLQVLLFFIGGIVIIAILIGKSPASLFAGLGASAAILMLVFKDTILVKIQNFDNTISIIPPYTLVSASFQNWRGMVESGGRRVMKSIFLDLNTIKFCTPDMLNTFRKEIPLLADYKPDEGVTPTNSQMFRVYVEKYLTSLPVVNTDLDLIISQLQSTEYGVPIQIYFFSRNKIWKEYERIQSDIFDHFFAMVPKFELKVYQYSE